MEEYTFKAEINELMHMIIHNFYSNRDIFLRELISNASDAINKVKHNSLSEQNLLNENYDFQIKIKINKEEKTIVIEDSGIGMTKEDLINNLGTIAKSGTKEFIKKLSQNENGSVSNNLIGQFGVGFYSAYLIADNVSVVTRYAGTNDTFEWISNANGTFKLNKIDDELKRGTRMTLYVKEDAIEYLEENKLLEIIKKHSSYITYPILLHKIVSREESVEEDVLEVEHKEDDVQKAEDVDENENSKPKTRTVTEEVWEKINSEPVWSKQISEISENEYKDFYGSITNTNDDYLTLKHFKTEGNIEFTSLLYIPKSAPFDMFEKKSAKNSIKLYVKKVLISDSCDDLYPEWMSFVKGVVDSQDLPLNASRELLQQSKILKQINKQLVKKTLEMVSDLSEDKEKYETFYKNFDKNIKLAVHEEASLREKIVELLRYSTSKGKMVSFAEYKDRMVENQPGIYFISGESIKCVENSPFVDKLKRLEYEIIYMIDPIDEYIIQHLTKYHDIKLINVSKDDLSLKEDENTDKQYDTLCNKLKELLKDKVDSVVVSKKIESQPAIITNPMGMSANMERIMKAQALQNKNANPMYEMMMSRRNLEINPDHPIMKKLNEKICVEKESNTVKEMSEVGKKEEEEKEEKVSKIEIEIDEDTHRLVDVVYESALLSGGYQVNDINNYLKKIYNYIN